MRASTSFYSIQTHTSASASRVPLPPRKVIDNSTQLTSQCRTNINNPDLLAHSFLPEQGHRVRDHNRTQCVTRIQLLDRVAAEDPVRDDADYLRGAVGGEYGGGRAERAAGVGHVVDKDAGFAAHFAG